MKLISHSTLSVHQQHEFLLKLEDAGLDGKLAQRVISSKDNRLAERIVRMVEAAGLEEFEPTSSQKNAREIMGKNFFGIEEAIKHFRVNPSRLQLAALSDIPFSETVLEELKNTHILVAVFPLAIWEIRNKVERKIFSFLYDGENEMWCQECTHLDWQLIRKTPVPDSTSKNWPQQKMLLGENDEVPRAPVMVYTIIGHYLSTGRPLESNEFLFEDVKVRTSSEIEAGYHICIGDFDQKGLNVIGVRDDWCVRNVGVASARKRL
jgi:hypothetical protein